MKKKNFLLLVSLFIMLHFVDGQYTKSSIDSLLLIYNSYSQLPDDTNKIDSLYNIAKVLSKFDYQEPLYNNNFISIRDIYFKALDLSITLGYQKGIQDYFNTLDYIYYLKTFTPIIEPPLYFDYISDKKLKDLHRYRNQNHFGSLYSYLIASDRLSKNHGIKQKEYLFNYRIGLCYYDWYNYSKAKIYFSKALDQAFFELDTALIGDLLMYLGISYYESSDMDSALINFNKALFISRKSKNTKEIFASYNNLGEVFYHEGEYDKALVNFQESQKNAYMLQDTLLITKSYFNMGKTLYKINKFEESIYWLNKALFQANSVFNKEIERDCYFILSELYAQKGEENKALVFYKKFSELKDSLFVNELDRFFEGKEKSWQTLVGREITKKEYESMHSRQTTIRLNKIKVYIYGLLFVISIAILLVYLISRAYKTKKKANEYLNKLNAERDKVISVISHDLRGPLSGFIMLLNSLKKNYKNQMNNTWNEDLDIILRQTGEMRQLLDNLLEWIKLQRGFIELNTEMVDIKASIENCLKIYSSLAHSKNIQIKSEIINNTFVFADKRMIDTVIRNLLDNAIKYTPQGGRIILRSKEENQMNEISVIDSGKGLSPDQIKNLFRSDSSITPGASKGLGLLLCKEYIEKCGGYIFAESLGSGKGSKFSFVLKAGYSIIESNIN
ncbi:MAG: tetratricopeptide repeat-containing sensor histidine kinase [Bacteroidales bacterium]|nr:tetratricopeptide repeat-containing sensor histidine kinase [Bacteroidales bacterium]